MAASRCVDTFVIQLIADLDCHLEIVAGGSLPGGETADTKQFVISPGNEKALTIHFEYYVGLGANESHDDYGFHYTIDNLNAGNATQMSLHFGTFNPPSPIVGATPNEIQTGYATFGASARATITYDNPDTQSLEGANNQNLGGNIILNTGVTEPNVPSGRTGA